jgi:ribosome-associated heat shock protein Hsp15
MMGGKSGNDDESVRIDRWLWAARFFKTRALAVEAVNGGHVHVNGQRVKPARAVHVNDELRIRRGPYEFVVQVRGVSQRRGPAAAARLLYEESDASRVAREQLALERRLAQMATPQTAGRPSKRDRRHIIRFRRDQD